MANNTAAHSAPRGKHAGGHAMHRDTRAIARFDSVTIAVGRRRLAARQSAIPLTRRRQPSPTVAGGTIADLLGRKRMFIYCVVLFTVASPLCAAADTVGQLVAFRVLQGMGAAVLVPASLALVVESSDEARRAREAGRIATHEALPRIMRVVQGGPAHG